jgi:hypothetical protein
MLATSLVADLQHDRGLRLGFYAAGGADLSVTKGATVVSLAIVIASVANGSSVVLLIIRDGQPAPLS